MNEIVAVARCWRCGRDWPADLQGKCPIDGAGVWLQRCIYERGSGRLKSAIYVWIGPCCKLEHSGPETDFYYDGGKTWEGCVMWPIEKFEPLGEQILFVAPNVNNTFGSVST